MTPQTGAGARIPGTPDPLLYCPGYRGVRLAADAWGDSDSPLVLLLHGGGQTRHAWKGAGQRLGAAGYHAVAYDARGHGDSDWAPDGLYTQEGMVEDLRAVVAAFGQRRPALVGASMGGTTSLTAVGENAVDATALVLVDIAPRIERAGTERIRTFMEQNPEGFDSLEHVAAAIAEYQPHRRAPPTLDGLAKNLRIAANGKYRWHWDPRYLVLRQDIERRRAHMTEYARKLEVPTLLVRGGLSDVLSEEGAREFLALCPQCEYVSVADAAHMVAGDRNDVFASAVHEFLSRKVPVDG